MRKYFIFIMFLFPLVSLSQDDNPEQLNISSIEDCLFQYFSEMYAKYNVQESYAVGRITINADGQLLEWKPLIRKGPSVLNENHLYYNMPKFIPLKRNNEHIEYKGLLLYDGKKKHVKLLQENEFQTYKRIPVVRWHPDEDAYFSASIDASFMNCPEYIEVNVVNYSDTLFTHVNKVIGSQRTTSELNLDRNLLLNTDSIFLLQLHGNDRRAYNENIHFEYFGIKRGGGYEFGYFKGGYKTYSFSEMVKKAFGSLKAFQKKTMDYYYNAIYGGFWPSACYPPKIDNLSKKPQGAKKKITVTG